MNLNLDLKILRYFLMVANTHNITKAAELLHITQPTLSRQLMVLEEHLGVQLFARKKRMIELTTEGLFLKHRAREMLDLADQTQKDLVDLKSNISGVVSVGLIESVWSETLYQLMAPIAKQHSNVQFNLHSGQTDELLEKMEHGLIDLCLLLEPVDSSQYNVIRLTPNERWGVIMRQDDPLAQQVNINIRQLVALPMLWPARPEIYSEIENWFGKHKYQLNRFGSYNLMSNAILAVEQGMGYAICLNSSVIEQNSLVCFRPIIPEKTTQSVIIWKKNRNFDSAAEFFVKAVYRHFNMAFYAV